MTPRVVAVLGRGIVDPDRPVVHGDDLGFTRGDGCFEGCRVLTAPDGTATVDKLERHLDRFGRSAAALEIDFDLGAWHALIAEAIAGWAEPGEAGMRVFLSRGRDPWGAPFGLVMIAPIPPSYPKQRRDGITVVTLTTGLAHDAFAHAPWLLGGVKTMSYARNMAAQREAARRGADDAILVSADGWVLESPTGSVVWARGGVLGTIAPGENGILPGTTQQLLFDRAHDVGWATETTLLRAGELGGLDGLWLVGSVRGPVAVTSVDGQPRDPDQDLTWRVQQLAGF